MASSPSSALMASSSCSTTTMYTGGWDHDVFLCFRGDDSRHGFTSHLMAALSDKKIKAFIDTMLPKTESIDELLSVLERSALSIVIFSRNFADSSWCLDEVATIAQSMAKFGHRVLPVFYKVGWSDVAGDSGSYSVTIRDKLEANSDDNKRWRDALKAVANCAGRTSEAIQIEAELIKAIVGDVQKQLIDMSPCIKSNNFVGMGSRVFEVERLLAMEKEDETRIIGLWGMGGAGKTTLAKACYERIISSTKGIQHHFIRNINGSCAKQHGVEGIVHELYSKVLEESNLCREDLDMRYRRARLSSSKVLIVLDDVDTPLQLEQLLLGDVFNLTTLFAPGSRIIVTTRDKKVLQNVRAETYHVTCLSENESIQLFSLRAFRKHSPPDNWMDLSRRAVSYCNGNPLALKVLGGTLLDENRLYWESLLSGLRLIENRDIHHILRPSYDKLEPDERRLFLEVACFLHGMSRSTVIGYLEALDRSAYAKVKNLVDRSLLICVSKKDEVEKIEVHDLLKEMAWKIVNEEPRLGKRSRLVNPDDIYKLLASTKIESWMTFLMRPFKGIEMMMVLPTRKRRRVTDKHRNGNCVLEGGRTTEGISLDLYEAKEMRLEANAFEGMDSLTFLKFYDDNYKPMEKIHLPDGGLDSLPDGLRYLHWDYYPSKSLPLRFYPQHLVHVVIRRSPIKKCWEGFDQPTLVNLMVLDLSYCYNLAAIPDISCSLKLEELLLQSCKSLVELPSHVQCLDKLITIDLGYCENLERLPAKLNSKLLQHVRINNCPKVKHCPDINSSELVGLNLNGTPIREMPNAIHCLKQDGELFFYGENITNFPLVSVGLHHFEMHNTAIEEIDSSELLSKFNYLQLDGNLQLKSLPKNIWNMVSSRLTITDSPLLESLPEISSEPIISFTHLNIANWESIKCLPSSINHLVSLSHLTLRNTSITSLPSSISELDRLLAIELTNCKSLESIPSSILKLTSLSEVYMSGCRSLATLPELPPKLSSLDVSGCTSLQALPSNASKLPWHILKFLDCPLLDRMLPNEIMANYQARVLSSWCSSQGVRNLFPNELVYSGREIPEWFAYKSMEGEDNSFLTVQLPLANCTSSKQGIQGIAFGVVWSSDVSHVELALNCDCHIGTIKVASSWTYYASYDYLGGTNSSNNVHLWFDKLSSKEREEAWYVKYAGHTVLFRFYLDVLNKQDAKRLKNFKIKRCGFSLLYNQFDDQC